MDADQVKLGSRIPRVEERRDTVISSMLPGTIGGDSALGMPIVETRRSALGTPAVGPLILTTAGDSGSGNGYVDSVWTEEGFCEFASLDLSDPPWFASVSIGEPTIDVNLTFTGVDSVSLEWYAGPSFDAFVGSLVLTAGTGSTVGVPGCTYLLTVSASGAWSLTGGTVTFT